MAWVTVPTKKGKPGESQGRKATGLQSHSMGTSQRGYRLSTDRLSGLRCQLLFKFNERANENEPSHHDLSATR
jgi:hypothetical protein